jgi:putative polyketide hydroxylase
MNREPAVLIVGAGTAGLVTAIELGRRGIATLVIEKRSSPSTFPRATGISLRSMELVRSWGLEAEVREGEIDVGTTGWMGGPLALDEGRPTSLGFPSVDEARALSPTTPVAAPQDHLEPVLLRHLATLESVEVCVNTELVGLDQGPDGVTAVVCRNGEISTVRARFAVGADGAHSTVRTGVGIAMVGPDDLGSYYTVTFRAPLMPYLGECRHALYMVGHPEAGGVYLPTDNQNRWVFAQPYNPSTVDPMAIPYQRLVELIRMGTGVPDLPVRVERVGAFRFAAQVATTYRAGSVFLAGDAAHRTTPRGATGMNTAIQDGVALAWRLSWVLRGWADEGLLDSYESTRRPVGLLNTERSASVEPRDSSRDWVDDLAGRIAHAWVSRDGRTVSTLDLIGGGLTLLTGPAGRPWSQAVTDLTGSGATAVPVTVHGVDARAAAALGIMATGAVLVGPDAIPVATWPTAEARGLAEAIHDLVGWAHLHAR